MRYEFKPSFERSIKTLSTIEKDEIKAECLAFLDLIDHSFPQTPHSILIREATSKKNSFDQTVKDAGSFTNGSTSLRI